jgi:hypothetical protein
MNLKSHHLLRIALQIGRSIRRCPFSVLIVSLAVAVAVAVAIAFLLSSRRDLLLLLQLLVILSAAKYPPAFALHEQLTTENRQTEN